LKLYCDLLNINLAWMFGKSVNNDIIGSDKLLWNFLYFFMDAKDKKAVSI
jgi:hypothetical protein